MLRLFLFALMFAATLSTTDKRNESFAAPPRFLRSGGDGVRLGTGASASATAGPDTFYDMDLGIFDTYNGDLNESLIAAINSGDNSAISQWSMALTSGLDGQTAISSPMIFIGQQTHQIEETGSVYGSYFSFAEWDLEWELDDESGTRDESATYLMELSITYSDAGTAVTAPYGFASYELGSNGDGISLVAGGNSLEVWKLDGVWNSTDGIDSDVHSVEDGLMTISVSKEVELEVGDSVTVEGLIQITGSAGVSTGTYMGVQDVVVQIKLTPI